MYRGKVGCGRDLSGGELHRPNCRCARTVQQDRSRKAELGHKPMVKAVPRLVEQTGLGCGFGFLALDHWCRCQGTRARQRRLGQQGGSANFVQEGSLCRFQCHQATKDVKQVQQILGILGQPVIGLDLV